MGMLSTARYMGETTRDYRLYQHSVQQRWFSVLEELTGLEVARLPYGYDGCGIPTLALPGKSLAKAMARMGEPGGLSLERKYATQIILQAVAEEPYLVAGADRLCSALMAETGKKVLVKVGADGCYTAILPEHGLGVALKVDDGNQKASEVLLGAVLQKLGAIDNELHEKLGNYFTPDITNSRGDVIGHIALASEAGLQ